MSDTDAIEDKLAGIQLAILELIWPAFTWIDQIAMSVAASKCSVYVQADVRPSSMERDDCARLLGEIFDEVLAGTQIRLEVICGKQTPLGYREVLSQEIFKAIAKEVAPWRLDAGR